MILAIFAIDEANGMGLHNSMPWPFNKEDMQWFRSITLNQVVVMGRKTWTSENMPKPLPNRINVVFTSNSFNNTLNDVHIKLGNVCDNLINLQHQFYNKNICVIGGADILKQSEPVVEKVFVTRIAGNYNCDVTINIDEYLKNFLLVKQTIANTCIFEEYNRIQ